MIWWFWWSKIELVGQHNAQRYNTMAPSVSKYNMNYECGKIQKFLTYVNHLL